MNLPDFIICGTQKGGTTALKAYLQQHPQIHMPPREIHFFSWYYDKSIKWYKKHFKHDHILNGEKSPSYMYPNPETVAERIHETIPKAKLIFMLRNPVQRAYSEYWMLVLNGEENQPFSKAVWNKNRDYLERGFYAKQIKKYLKYFDKNNIMILISEDFRKNRDERMKDVFKFLGVKPVELKTPDVHVGGMYKSKNLLRLAGLITKTEEKLFKHNPKLRFLCWDARGFIKRYNKIEGRKPSIPKDTEKKLYDFYKPHNEELICLLQELKLYYLVDAIKQSWKVKQ